MYCKLHIDLNVQKLLHKVTYIVFKPLSISKSERKVEKRKWYHQVKQVHNIMWIWKYREVKEEKVWTIAPNTLHVQRA